MQGEPNIYDQLKISQEGGKGIGTNRDCSVVPACATNHGVDFLLQDTADLWRVTVWVRLPFKRTEHSCCLDIRGSLITVFGSQFGMLNSLENSLASRFKEGRHEGNLCVTSRLFGNPLNKNEHLAALKSIKRTHKSQSRRAGEGHTSRALLGTVSGLTSPTNVLIQVEISNTNIDSISAFAVNSQLECVLSEYPCLSCFLSSCLIVCPPFILNLSR